MKIKNLLTIISFIVILGCGREYKLITGDNWDNRLLKWYYLLADKLLQYNITIPHYTNIKTAQYQPPSYFSNNEVGVCIIQKDKIQSIYSHVEYEYRTIYIDMQITKNIYLEEMVVYHEIGHCLLNWDHSTDPLSLMYPNVNIFVPVDLQIETAIKENQK